MDPITHGIAGSLLGKGLFTEREGRVATFAATLGAVFPDVDIFAELASRDPLSIIKLHRGFTHSFVGLPIFAVALAWLTRWYCARRNWKAPSFGMLTLIYGVGIASHLLLDATTSFGTRLWNPFSTDRVAWDMLFIIDFSFTAIVLLPQVAAWVFRDREKARGRAALMWLVFSACGAGVWAICGAFGFPFHFWVLGIVSGILAVIFLLPLAGGFGFEITQARWCQLGLFVAAVYIAASGVAHHDALERVKAFVAENHLEDVRLGAIPIPPSILDWSGKIRTSDGVYQARFDLRDAAPPTFQFLADSPHDQYIAEAMNLPDVRTYLWFARFPVIHSHQEGEDHIVEFGDSRFSDQARRMPSPFRFRLVFDTSGKLLEEDWAEGASGLRMRRIVEKNAGPAKR